MPVNSCQHATRRARRARIHWQPATGNWQLLRPAFTLTEVLIVIGIILLLVLLALPAFSIFRGERSTEAAENQLSALLARARTEAIGYQRAGGVMFFRDPREPDRVSVAAVQEVESPGGPREVYLDLVPDREFVVLPAGVGIQVVDDCRVNDQNVRQDDGYIHFNKEVRHGPTGATNVETETPIGGVILYDFNGRLMSVEYGFRIRQPSNSPGNGPPSPMGELLFYMADPGQTHPRFPGSDFVDPGSKNSDDPPNDKFPLRSQFGLIAYDQVAYQNAFPNAGTRDRDPQLVGGIGTTYLQGEKAEEDWLDTNGVPLLVNRYNGTITRGLQ